MVSPRWIREMLTGEFDRGDRPQGDMPHERFPFDAVLAEVSRRAQAEEERDAPFVEALLEWDERQDDKLKPADLWASHKRPSDTERHAARGLGVKVTWVKLAARYPFDHRISMTSVISASLTSTNSNRAADRSAGVSSPARCSPNSGPSSSNLESARKRAATVSGKWSTPKRCSCKDANGKELGRPLGGSARGYLGVGGALTVPVWPIEWSPVLYTYASPLLG
jgi:hypothetical protein